MQQRIMGSVKVVCGGVTLCLALSAAATGEEEGKLHEPLPLEVVVTVHNHNGRSPIRFSPDGQWLAHTVATDETVPRDPNALLYSPTGVPFGEGDARMEARLTHTRTGEVIRLGTAAGTHWSPVWSPDGQRVAFYSDGDGEAGLWIWERGSGAAHRVPGTVIRPLFGFEQVDWSPDGRRLLVKVLSPGVGIAEANALEQTQRGGAIHFPAVPSGQPSVWVRKHPPDPAVGAEHSGTEPARGSPTDLAIVDVETRRVRRLVQDVRTFWYAFSPDGRYIAYTVVRGEQPATQQVLFDLRVIRVNGGDEPRVLIGNIRLNYGIECRWSPDSRRLACIDSGQMGSGEIVSVTLSDGAVKRFGGEGGPGRRMPSFNPGHEVHPPMWSPDSRQLFALGAGELWRIDLDTGVGHVVGSIQGQRIRAVVKPFDQPAIWSSDGGRTVWLMAQTLDGAYCTLHALDLKSGRTREVLREPKTCYGSYSLSASTATGELALVTTGSQQLPDIWLFNTREHRLRRATRLNGALDRYALGESRILRWKGPDDQPLAGTLLLPPGYREGQRLPLVVDVYGGDMGSQAINRFGGRMGNLPAMNMYVLTTRGYAVLLPDAPLRQGRTMTDIVPAVLGGVDAAIEAGYVDPERLAVIGQSYGAYNVLSLITQTTRFKAASITAAVTHPDLFAAYLENIGYFEQGQGNMGGSIWEYHARYADNSPLFFFDRIETPLLIGQGERDGNLVSARAIFTALQRLDKPVELRIYEGEGHVITRKHNVIDFWQRRLDFFAEHLGLTASSQNTAGG